MTEAGSRTAAPFPHFFIVTLICLSPFLSMALLCQLVSHVLTMEIHPVFSFTYPEYQRIVTKLKREAGLYFPPPCYHGSLIKVSQAQQRSLQFVRDRESL